MSARNIIFSVETQMVTETCCNCGLLFAMTADFVKTAKKPLPGKTVGMTWHCPNGHAQHYNVKNEADELRRERDRLNQRLAEWQEYEASARADAIAEKRRAAAFKGQATKLRARAKAGVCPCCNRQFADMHRHMTTKHPTFAPEAPELTVIDGGKAA